MTERRTQRRLRTHPRPARRLGGDDGAIIIELALVGPLLVLLLLGIFEFGTVLRNKNIVSNALRAAARVESQQPNTATVDKLAIQTFMASTNGLKNMTLLALVVYSAPTGGGPTAACRAAANPAPTGTPPFGRNSGSGICNIYNLSEAQTVAADTTGSTNSHFGCGGLSSSSTTWDGFYCPVASVRPTTLSTPMPEVGVYAVYTYKDVTSLMPGGTMTLSDYAVFAIQPSV